MPRKMRRGKGMKLLGLLSFMLWFPPSTAGLECLGKCDDYENYYCSTFFGVCEPCLTEGDSPKCAQYFQSLRKPSLQGTPPVEPSTPSVSETPQLNDTILPYKIKLGDPVKSERKAKDNQEQHNPSQQGSLIDLRKNTDKGDKHTDVLIIVASVLAVTLCAGMVVRLHRRNRSSTGTRTTTVMLSGDGEDLPEVVVDQRIGTGRAPQGGNKEETAL